MEGKSDQQGSHGLRVLDNLKKHLFDITDTSSHKSLSSREVCTSFVDLTESVCNASQKPSSGQLISQTVELLVHACSSSDHHIRLAASENLKRLIKVLMFSHLSRIQQDLFHELKKNGTSRSLCVALDCFASLFPLTRPSKCSSYAQGLLPIVVRLTCRQEEALHEALQGALSKILPTMTPFLSTTNLQFLMTGLVNRLPTGTPTYRRMASSALVCIVLHCRSPSVQAEWLMNKLMGMGCHNHAKSEIVQGVLLVFQQLFSNMTAIDPPLICLKQAFCFLLSCLLYRDTNTSISALESLHQLLLSTTSELSMWFISEQQNGQVAIDYWTDDTSSIGNTSDTHSIGEVLEIPCDSYFEEENVTLEYADGASDATQPSTGLSKVVVKSSPPEEEQSPSIGPVRVNESSCLVSKDDHKVVLKSLMKYLMANVLKNGRVSAQSLGLACMTAAVDYHPSLFLSLETVTPFTTAQDPKLRNRAVKLLATVISSQLRSHHRDLASCPPVVKDCTDLLVAMLDDDTPVVLKAVCEALQLCLPSLVSSTQPEIVVDIVHKLLPFRESSYWLTKVELLQTLGCLDFTSLAIIDPRLPEVVLGEVIFELLGDVDHRVRAAACQCLVQLAPNLDLGQDRTLSLAKCHSTELFLHLHSSVAQLSLAGIGDSMNKDCPKPPLGLEHLLWFLIGKLSSSVDVSLQLGCLEALHSLSEHFPPPSLPDVWGCSQSPCTLLDLVLQMIKSSKLAWGVQAHGDLLEVTTSVFLSCALSHLPETRISGQSWAAVNDPDLVSQATHLLTHTLKLLCVFVHVIEQREPELREKKLTKPILSPKKPVVGDSPSPSKPKSQLLEPFQKPPLTPRDGLGQFAALPHFMKIYDACKAAYSNYKLSLSAVGTDKFSKLLQNCHNSLAALLEIATADDIGKYVEEILGYIAYTVKVDPAGGLLCVQQLLNALFGLNTAAQHTHIYSPYISSLPYNLVTLHRSVSSSVYDVSITEPLSQLFPWLQGLNASTDDHGDPNKRRGLIPGRRTMIVKPMNSVSSIKDYIGYFEPLVVHALSQFSSTSSTVLQQRVIFLLVQLLQLKVRYELLDCHHTFLESVLKLINLMETGVVKGGETLVPHLFQFLVLLAHDQSKLITIPEVMQKCDGVMASGHNVLTFAIPALQPLILNLFVRPAKETQDLEIQREVVVSMLLRLVEYSKVVVLLTHVLDCYKRKKQKWHEASNQIFAALLPQIGKLRVVLDNSGSLVSLYQLLTAMDPTIINVEAIFTAVFKPKELESVSSLIRWLGGLCTTLALMASSLQEKTVLDAIKPLSFTVPSLSTTLAQVQADVCETDTDTVNRLAVFLQGALCLAASTLNQLLTQNSTEDHNLLSFLVVNMLLILQKLVKGGYKSLRAAFAILPSSPTLLKNVSDLSTLYPLLTLTFINFSVTTRGIKVPLLLQSLVGDKSTGTSSKHLLQHTTLLLLNSHWLAQGLTMDSDVCTAVAKSPALLDHCQKPGVNKFIRLAQEQSSVRDSLVQLIKTTDTSSILNCVNVVRLASCVPCVDTFKYLCLNIVPHSVTAIGIAAERVAVEMLDSGALKFEVEEMTDFITELTPFKDKFGVLLSLLYKQSAVDILFSEDTSSSLSKLELADISVGDLDKAWYVEKVKKFCRMPGVNSEVCAGVLGNLEIEDLTAVVDDESFPICLLENCITHGIFLSLNKDSLSGFEDSLQLEFPAPSTQHDQVETLLQVSMKQLIRALKADHLQPSLIFPLVRLLAAKHQLSHELSIDEETVSALLESSLPALSRATNGSDPLALQTALDYCALLLRFSEVRAVLPDEWVIKAVNYVAKIFIQVYPVAKAKVEEFAENSSKDENLSGMDIACHQLVSMLNVLLESENELAVHSLESSLRYFTFALCRLPAFHDAVMTPAALKGDGKISEKILDQALMESEILIQYMQRGNFIGWLNRHQFEERWMQLLGVVNQPPPQEGEFPEEYHAYTLNVCAGVQAVTSLLLSTLLRPHLGDPTSSVPMHTYRSNDLLFLGSRPGRKLAQVRKILEQKVLLQCGTRLSVFDYYQSPVLHLFASSHYPPLYSRNIERMVGDTSVGVGQLSLNSLWPVMLMEVGSNYGYMSDSVEVDVKSCIISLIELYTHWLSSPVHTLQLQYTLQSIIMLSDLFSVSAQMEWMLGTMVDMYERHPFEDVSSISLTVLGMLKATAILKLNGPECEKIAKIVEKSLVGDSPPILQSACIHGLLYVAEDPNSHLISLTCPVITKFLSGYLQNFQRYTDRTLTAVWSLAVCLSLQHTNHIKDPNFTSGLLEQVSHILHHPSCSFPLFQSITLGLELMVVNFSLSADDRKSISTVAANRFVRCEQAKSLSALALLITCMYTGEAANVASGVNVPQSDTLAVETTLQAREQINNLMERLRHGPLTDVQFLVDVLPELIVDFLPPMEVLQTVVTDFVSPHQTRPVLAAAVLNKTFLLLLRYGEQPLLIQWILLSLESFVQQEPESKAIWSITCLLASASTNEYILSLSKMMCYWTSLPDTEAVSLLCLVAQGFFSQCTEPLQQEQFLSKLSNSKCSSLRQVAQYCEET